MASRRIVFATSCRRRMRKILDAGIAPTHIDTHKHTHLAPPGCDAVARIAEEFWSGVGAASFDLPITAARGDAPWLARVTTGGHGISYASGFIRVLADHNCRTTIISGRFQLTGRFRAAELVRLIRELPDGTTEFMCHPGRCRDHLRQARTRLKESREQELAALVDPKCDGGGGGGGR